MKQRGMTTVTALFLITIMAAMAVTGASLFAASREAATLEFLTMRAREAAAGGIEAALLAIQLSGNAQQVCLALPMNIAMPQSLAQYTVTVSCSSVGPYTEDADNVTSFRLNAVACNQPGANGMCPNTNADTGYIEQERVRELTL